MPSHMSDIGFGLESEDDYQQLALKACEHGHAWRTASGTYIRWSPGEGIELWAQLDHDGEIIGLNPHFRGKGLMRIGLAEKINRPDGTILDGGFYGWANPSDTDPESGEFPLVFDLPDWELHEGRLGSIVQVQLAAFAHELKSYESIEAFEQSQSEKIKFASQSFIPSGLFTTEDHVTDPPQAHAIFTGHVLETSVITNPATGSSFCWAAVATLGGAIDVVADPILLNGLIVRGGVLSGSFWLSGLVLGLSGNY